MRSAALYSQTAHLLLSTSRVGLGELPLQLLQLLDERVALRQLRLQLRHLLPEARLCAAARALQVRVGRAASVQVKLKVERCRLAAAPYCAPRCCIGAALPAPYLLYLQ